MGERRGLVVSTEDCSSKGQGIESRSFSFFYSLTYLQQTVVKKCGSRKVEQVVHLARRKAGAANRRGKTGRRFRNGYEKGERRFEDGEIT